MNLQVWRIVNAKWATTPFDGQGAKTYGGRWNSVGTSVVYTSSSLSLATLELLVHLGVKTTPKSYISIPADIPDELIIEQVNQDNLPDNWKNDPPPLAVAAIGDQWINSNKSAVLRVPSAVIDEEWNYLLNPEHSDFYKIKIGSARQFHFDSRLFE